MPLYFGHMFTVGDVRKGESPDDRRRRDDNFSVPAQGTLLGFKQDSELDWCLTHLTSDLIEVDLITGQMESSVYFSSRMVDIRDELIVHERLSEELPHEIIYIPSSRSDINGVAGVCSYNALIVARASVASFRVGSAIPQAPTPAGSVSV